MHVSLLKRVLFKQCSFDVIVEEGHSFVDREAYEDEWGPTEWSCGANLNSGSVEKTEDRQPKQARAKKKMTIAIISTTSNDQIMRRLRGKKLFES